MKGKKKKSYKFTTISPPLLCYYLIFSHQPHEHTPPAVDESTLTIGRVSLLHLHVHLLPSKAPKVSQVLLVVALHSLSGYSWGWAQSHGKPTHGCVARLLWSTDFWAAATFHDGDFQVLSVVASSRPLAKPFHPSQTVVSSFLGSSECTAVTEGKAQLFQTSAPFHLLWLSQLHSTQFCEAGQEVKKKVQEKKTSVLKKEISACKDAQGKRSIIEVTPFIPGDAVQPVATISAIELALWPEKAKLCHTNSER